MGGNHARIEAPYIVYDPDTDYYCLFLSFGGLNVDDGYNLRVCRSHDVEGPYEDARGHDMRDCMCRPGNFWNDDDVAPYGVKLMGGYQFTPLAGENSPEAQTVRSPGHNSAWRDPETGRWFLIHHTRFAGNDGRYIVQTREMFFNEDGWPCVSPTRFVAGRIAEEPRQEGAFKLIFHGQDVNRVEHTSVAVTLSADGIVSGERTGSFASEDDRVTLTLDGTEYRGVATVGYDADQDAFVTALTALSKDGQAVWGLRATGQD